MEPPAKPPELSAGSRLAPEARSLAMHTTESTASAPAAAAASDEPGATLRRLWLEA